jgi:HK97 family phage major capsid protein
MPPGHAKACPVEGGGRQVGAYAPATRHVCVLTSQSSTPISTLLKSKAKYAAKRAECRKIVDDVAASPEIRDMNPDEKSRFEKGMAELEVIKGQIAQLSALDADEDAAEEEEEAVPEPRSHRRSAPIGQAPAIHTDKKSYSILRALRLAVDGKALDGLEGEVSKEIEKRTGRKAEGFFLPTGSDPEIRALMDRGRSAERRDLTTTTGAGGIFNVPELPLIELLRAKLVVASLGAKYLTGMQGTFSIPRQSGTASVFWVAEGSPATASNPSLDQVAFTPKVAIAATTLTRKFINQTSLDAEQLVKEDLAEMMARELDRVAINGSGTNQPLGILANTTIQTNSSGLAIGTNGGPVTFASVVGMESQVAAFNADRGSLAYLTSPSQRGKLKTAPKIGTTFPTFIWEDGEVNGYRAEVTTNVPSNIIKGSGTGLSALIYGNFNDLIIAQWDGVDVLINPYTPQLNGGVTVSMNLSVDVQVRHAESFAIITDAQ